MSHRSVTISRRTATLITAAAVTVSAGAGIGTQTAAAATRATPAASPVATSRADIDGDGRADRTTLTKVRTTTRGHTFRLTTRTAKGRTVSTTITVPNERDDLSARDVLWGAAPLDGVPGADIVIDCGGGIADTPSPFVYTMRGNTLRTLRAPGAKSDRTPWLIANHPALIAGYQFSRSKGVSRVIATRLQASAGTWEDPIYTGYRTTYRWGRTGWISNSTQWVKDLPSAQAEKLNGIIGVTLR